VEIADQKKGRANFFRILLFGIIILISAVLTHLLILQGVIGNFYYSELIPNEKEIRDIFLNTGEKIAILYPEFSKKIIGEDSRIEDEIKWWERILSNSKIKYEIIDDGAIESGKHFNFKIIILPESKFFSDGEVVQLKKYIENGGSIFALGETALYSENGMWRGWDFMSDIFGIKFIKEISNDESYPAWIGSQSVQILKGGLSLTANIPSGYLLKVNNHNKLLAVEVLKDETIEAGFWFDKQSDRFYLNENINKNSGIVYGTYGNGRFVWMGFKISSVYGIEDKIYLGRLIDNSIRWLNGSPSAVVKDLPYYNKKVEIKADKKWKRRVAVSVSNYGSVMVSCLTAEVDLNDKAFNLNLSREIIDVNEAEFRHKIGGRIVYLLINNLKPNESRTYFLDYDRPDV